MRSKGFLDSLAMLVERLRKEEAAPTPPLQNWGRDSAVSSQPLRLDKLFLGRLAKLGKLLQAIYGDHAK